MAVVGGEKMVKVKAKLVPKEQETLEDSIVIDIPKEFVNRKGINDYVKSCLLEYLNGKCTVAFEVVE